MATCLNPTRGLTSSRPLTIPSPGLTRACFALAAQVRIPEGYTLDLVVAYNGLRIAVEVDGPSRACHEP